ncbi:MAG: NAD-dependent epimerase/dehydratase family protein [SAR202 cluster bacterium]|nr:NAD-dependent epimerase/dehydratase family protein [SAR202 cluster bacterium]
MGTTIVVAGGGGFIGGHLVADLLKRGQRDVRVIDVKPFDEWWQLFQEADNWGLDLSDKADCEEVLPVTDVVYNLAADMGRMGSIAQTHLFMAARKH